MLDKNPERWLCYVLKHIDSTPEDKMIVPIDEKRGRLLLAEILDGGNFGRHFTKYARFTHQMCIRDRYTDKKQLASRESGVRSPRIYFMQGFYGVIYPCLLYTSGMGEILYRRICLAWRKRYFGLKATQDDDMAEQSSVLWLAR